MTILIKTVGSPDLARQVRSLLEAGTRTQTLFASTVGHAALLDIPKPNDPSEIAYDAEEPAILLADARNASLLGHIEQLRTQLQMQQLDSRALPLLACPLLLVATGDGDRRMLPQLGVADDWLFADRLDAELGIRALASLKRTQAREYPLAAGKVSLTRAIRMLEINGRRTRLSPTEYTLAEYFFGKFGTLVTLRDLVTLFATTGKSDSMNNIRVSIYQLRLKIEELSKEELTIMTMYRKGYVLRQAMCPQGRNAPETRTDYVN